MLLTMKIDQHIIRVYRFPLSVLRVYKYDIIQIYLFVVLQTTLRINAAYFSEVNR